MATIAANSIKYLHDRFTKSWHEDSHKEPQVLNSWQGLLAHHHFANCELWHLEDEARIPDASDSVTANAKRKIDSVNQRRNDLVEEIDEQVLKVLNAHALPDPEAPLHSETPGLIVDRLSILELKIYHTREEIRRKDSPSGHSERNQQRLKLLEEQRTDLAFCLDSLWRDILEGKKSFKVYRQLKMYNDRELNPAIYSKRTH
jgi:hypothetical protein